MFRFLLGVAAGLALAFVGVIAVEMFSAVVHPFPEGFPSSDEGEVFQQAICRHVENYPHWVLAAAAAMWLAIIYASVRAAVRIGSRAAGLVVSVLLMAALTLNILMLPYTVWFEVVMLVGGPVVALLAVRSGSPATAPPTGDDLPAE